MSGEPLSRKDAENLRAAIDVMQSGIRKLEEPFGAVVVGPDGNILLSQYNTSFSAHDHTRHAESVLASKFSHEYYDKPRFGAECTLYSSVEPCPMCMFTIGVAGIGRVVYGLSSARLYEIGNRYGRWPQDTLSSHDAAKYMGRPVKVEGPFLEDEVAQIVEDAINDWFTRNSGR